ncbi:MAG: DUF3387 domain-containing protein [Microthrixaceae bacterium]
MADAVDQLLDRSVGAEEYVIRAAVEGSEPDPLIDLSQIDFDSLAASFAGRKRAETERLAALLKDRATAAAARNPTRQELVERIEELIARYNAGSFNNDEMLRRLVSLSQSLSKEEQRAFEETLDEESLAIFDLLTQPEPVLTDDERATVKESAKALLAKLHDQLVIDWRRRAETMAGVRTTIKDVLDTGLPEDPYPPGLFDSKVDAVFNHIVASYGDDGASVYHDGAAAPSAGGTTTLDRYVVSADTETATQVEPPPTTSGRTDQLPDIAEITEDVVERLRHDEQFVSEMAARIGQAATAQLRTVDELIENDEDFAVEFKSTARWDVKQGVKSKVMEDMIVKTVAGFLNTDGGTLLIGVGPDLKTVGLSHDYENVKPKNGDGFVNWLTTHLINALGPVPATRTRARIVIHEGHEICRVDVAEMAGGVRAKSSKAEGVFYVRFNNSTRVLPDDEVGAYAADRWPDSPAPSE